MKLPTLKSSSLSQVRFLPTWKRVALGVGLAVFCIQWVRLGIRPTGDFHLHWELGRRMAAGEFIYTPSDGSTLVGGHDHPYPPFWGLVHVPLTLVPMRVAQLLLYALFGVALAGLLAVMERLTQTRERLGRDAAFGVAVVAVVLSSRFLVRDMLECGVNLAIVGLSWLGVLLWTRRRDWPAGVCLGLATALKCTPALFIAWFAWKRQWKMTAASTVATLVFTLSPILWMGPGDYLHAIRFWGEHASLGVRESDPSRGVLGDEPLQNMALRPSLARFLMALPEGHKGRLDHPAFVDVFDLPPATAGVLIKLVMLGLLAVVAWRFHEPAHNRNDARWVWECAAVSLLILLYSPLTWGQHCVAVLPACYLLASTIAGDGRLSRWMWCVLGVYIVCLLVLNRAVLGKTGTLLLDGYHIPTACVAGLLAVVVSLPGRICRSHRPTSEMKVV